LIEQKFSKLERLQSGAAKEKVSGIEADNQRLGAPATTEFWSEHEQQRLKHKQETQFAGTLA